MDADRLLTMIHDECTKSPEGRADRATVERRFGPEFEDAFLALMNQDCIAKNGPADTISLLPTGRERAEALLG
ncbi:hypothetical protein [Microvirga makkahensis]|uniref:Uncharacterized protein n=1 Tax=Microvirga makkahensis TaxID=1128670 RepID=A0A7X3SPN7_9HYPH|nr:hypothetical protein [Microvirga makkahensis]MXQ12319.1 hypothetical protein [Microvirga makkahensis]